MIRTRTTFRLAAALLAGFAGLAMGGCSAFDRVGAAVTDRDRHLEEPRPAQPQQQHADAPAPRAAEPMVVNASTGVNAGFAGLFSPVSTPAERPSGTPIEAPSPWSATPGAGIFGEIGDSHMGPTSFGLQHSGAENLAQMSFATEGADFDPDVSPDGTFITFASTQHGATADIYRKGVNGHTITQLTNDPANDVMPAISPDGARIAFASDRGGTWDIYIMNADGGQAMQLTNDPAPQLHPTWSPDGRRIAFCRLGETSGRWELWVTEVANPAVRHFIGYGLLPDWSPDGNKITFQRSRQRGDRFFSVWTIDYDNGEGRNPTEIVSSPVAACVNPTFSRDGSKIAFAVVPNPEAHGASPQIADLWITNVDGTGRANLTGGLFTNLMPAWGPDGRIFFISDRSGTENIWSLRPDRAILAATGPQPASNTGLAQQGDNANTPAVVTVPDDEDPQ